MKFSFRGSNLYVKLISSVVYDLPVPVNISYMWNFGSLLGSCLFLQIITGLFLVAHYTPEIDMAFGSVIHIMREVNYGWLIRSFHANGASFFFFCLYFHIGRGLFYHSFYMRETWLVGTTIFLLTMAAAFLGYVLPWGQMSFWGATVITNLVSAIPYVGAMMVDWLWGGFSVGDATLKRFFMLHYLIPFIILALVVVHVVYLHDTGSNNPLGVKSDSDKIPFHLYFVLKDVLGIVFIVILLSGVVLMNPDIFMDPVNFYPADPLNTPLHIQPEWYFLFAYAILRTIPSKLGGVIALLCSVLILYVLPFISNASSKGFQFSVVNRVLFWVFVGNFMILTWIGACPIESPYFEAGVVGTVYYFLFFILFPFSSSDA